MQMPIVVGVIVGIVFLVAFSEWFYHLVSGWKEYVLDDVYFKYRIAGVSLLSILIMTGTFMGMAYFNECRNEERSGVFAGLSCDEYSKIVTGTEKVLMRVEK